MGSMVHSPSPIPSKNDELDRDLWSWCALHGKTSEDDYNIRADRSEPRWGWRAGEPVPDHSVDLVIGSPPFGSGVPYPSGYDDRKTQAEVTAELTGHFGEIARVLRPGRYMFVNIPLMTKIDGVPYCWLETCLRCMSRYDLQPIVPPILVTLEHGLEVLPEGPQSRTLQFAIGADLILGASLGTAAFDPTSIPDLSDRLRRAWRRNVWEIPFMDDLHVCAVNPVPWSREIPYRLALLASMPGELIVDPWCGSCRTAAALMGGSAHCDHPMRGRRFLGQDLAPQIPSARTRLQRDWSNRAKPWRSVREELRDGDGSC